MLWLVLLCSSFVSVTRYSCLSVCLLPSSPLAQRLLRAAWPLLCFAPAFFESLLKVLLWTASASPRPCNFLMVLLSFAAIVSFSFFVCSPLAGLVFLCFRSFKCLIWSSCWTALGLLFSCLLLLVLDFTVFFIFLELGGPNLWAQTNLGGSLIRTGRTAVLASRRSSNDA